MTNFTEASTFDTVVYQIATSDPVQGGPTGITNNPLQALVNRSRWLKNAVDALVTSVAAKANLNGPDFTGSPTAATPAAGDDSTALATTAAVHAAAGGVTSINVAGNSNVTLTAAQWGVKVIILTGVLTGNINVIFPTRGDHWVVINLTTGAFSVTCKTAGGSGIAVTQSKARGLVGDGVNIVVAENDLQDAALTGNPTAPNQTLGDSDTSIANTAFVAAAINALIGAAPSNLNTLVELAAAIGNDAAFAATMSTALGLKANALNAALTGIPTAPTAANGTNTTQLATTAFVIAALATIVAASTTVAGLVELATNAETTAGSDTVRAVTPASLASFAKNTTADAGYFVLPGGMIFQYVTLQTPGLSSYAFNWPLTFPNAALGNVCTNRGSVESAFISIGQPTTTGSTIDTAGVTPGSVFIFGVGF